MSLFRSLKRRQFDITEEHNYSQHNENQRFRGLCLQRMHDIHADGDVLFSRRHLGKISEIVCSKDILFVLLQYGLCAAYRREDLQLICFLNIPGKDEMIRSIFYNDQCDDLIAVLVERNETKTNLVCRALSIVNIAANQPDKCRQLFQSESLNYPSFVELDNVNKRVLTYSADKCVYKIWDLKTYKLLFAVPNSHSIQEVKISPGILLVLHRKKESATHVFVELYDIRTGEQLSTFTPMVHRDCRIHYCEMFGTKLFIKEKDRSMIVIDMCTGENVTNIQSSRFLSHPVYVFLGMVNRILTFSGDKAFVWDFNGKKITDFENHKLFFDSKATENVFIDSTQHFLFSFCRSNDTQIPSSLASSGPRVPPASTGNISMHEEMKQELENLLGEEEGSIHISDVFSGKLVHKVDLRSGIHPRNSANINNEIILRNRQLLTNITSLTYNEDTNEIYTGNEAGMVAVWSN